MKRGFFAYSSRPLFCEDAIEKAIEEINNGQIAQISSWKQLRVNGKFIINEVLSAIENVDFFCADLTGLNDNVLFEIGYAIGINKPVWLIFDTSHIESYRRYREIDFFSTIGYSKYSNTTHIVDSFYRDAPYNQNGSYENLTKNLRPVENESPLLFLKNQIDTNFSDSIIKSFNKHKLTYMVDDAVENKTQSISWYLSRLIKIPAILAEFSTNERTGYEIQNSKCSTICGIALGLGLKVLMLCEEPYDTPLDYKELLIRYSSPNECRSVVDTFSAELKNDYFELSKKKSVFVTKRKEQSDLNSINFGEFLAEHEGDRLLDYYIETSASSSLIKNEYNVVIGRKGSGKTATLYYLENYLKNDVRNHVCTIKPISFELDGLLYTLTNTPENFEKSYLIESAWKLLIYTEIAKSLFESINDKPLYGRTENENSFLKFIESKSEIFFTDFYERVEENLREISSTDKETEKTDFKIKISEILHANTLSEIRNQIINVCDKNQKIFVLIDNLDKSWRKEAELEYQSRWILGLLGLTGRIIKEFSSAKKFKKNLEFHLTIFLRTDIFNHILKYAREPDKIEYTKLKVEDKETLFRIIEERFVEISNNRFGIDELWEKYLPDSIDETNLKSFIYERIIPRPRDIIFFFNKIKETAINRGHTVFTEPDVKEAYKEYSEWVFSSIIVENGITIKQMEDFLYELIGESAVLLKEEILAKAEYVSIDLREEETAEKFIDHLVSLSILGREIHEGIFSFDFDLENDKKNKVLARKLGSDRYKIHNALIPALGCKI